MTLRELVYARQGAEYSSLEKLAELMALIANCHRDPKKSRPVRAYDIWHRPGAKRPQSQALSVDFLHGLREAFTKRTP